MTGVLAATRTIPDVLVFVASAAVILGGAVGVVTGGLIALMAAGGWYSGAHAVVAPTDPSNDVGVLGRSIFTTYLFAFEATSLLLIIAVVGAVMLARRTPDADDAVDAPADVDGRAEDRVEDAAPGGAG